MSEVEVVFSVDMDAPTGYSVYLTGSTTVLGEWDPLKAVKMNNSFSGQEWTIWSCSVTLDAGQDYSYRFFVGKENQHLLQPQDPESSSSPQETPLTVLKWEANVKPRVVSTKGDVKDKLEIPVAEFGNYDGASHVSKGWLINQYEIQLRLYSNPIVLYPDYLKNGSFSVRCDAIDLCKSYEQIDPCQQHLEDSPASVSDILVCKLNEADCVPQPQSPVGISYKTDDYILFKSQIPCLKRVGFKLSLFQECDTPTSPRLIGTAHLLTLSNLQSQSSLELPIVSLGNAPIGYFTVDVLKATPLPDVACTMETSYQCQWTWNPGRCLDIGHRGNGCSFNVNNIHKENTIASFVAAKNAGADMVEMDVLLTKDKTPVLYHDFAVNLSCCQRDQQESSDGQNNFHEVAVMDLTLSRLKTLKLYQSGRNIVELSKESGETPETEAFPTLQECLESVDRDLGFNIEIKFPQSFVTQVSEQTNFLDINENLDHILKVVLAHAGSRRVVFSSFDPDTCSLLQLKQNKFPVLYLHQGVTQMYTQYRDFRSSTFLRGAQFALAERLMGMALNCEVILFDIAVVTQLLQRGLVLFVWGSHSNDLGNIRALRQVGVHGIIYDRMDLNRPENKKRGDETNPSQDQTNDATSESESPQRKD